MDSMRSGLLSSEEDKYLVKKDIVRRKSEDDAVHTSIIAEAEIDYHQCFSLQRRVSQSQRN